MAPKLRTQVDTTSKSVDRPSINNFYNRVLKRFLDLFFSFFAIVFLSPVFLAVSILVWAKLGMPVFFKQERPCKNEKLFTLLKFRSMSNPKDKDGRILSDQERLINLLHSEKEEESISDNERLSKFGKILRASSLDELPELFNIMIGDMSFVGPRPLSKIYLPFYNENEKKRHLVRPGLTGLAQVNGRNSLSWTKRFEYDIKYVEEISFIMDVQIIIKTLSAVFSRKNINQAEEKPIAFHVIRQREWEEEKKESQNIPKRKYV